LLRPVHSIPMLSVIIPTLDSERALVPTLSALVPGGELQLAPVLLREKEKGKIRFLGITGHHDPAILLEAMRRFDFDTVLVALNAADVHKASFRKTVLVEAARRNMGVIGMYTSPCRRH